METPLLLDGAGGRLQKRMRYIVAIIFLIIGLPAMAQNLRESGTNESDIVPEGWERTVIQGDLNKDGVADLVIVAYPDSVKSLLAIYFGSAEGNLTCWKQYEEVIPVAREEFENVDIDLSITSKGVLRINISHSSDVGSYFTSTDKYSFRYQNEDFYMIGYEEQSLQRNLGTLTTKSDNYLTWKRKVRTENIFEDEGPAPKEKWSTLPHKALEKLGEKEL